MRHLNLPFIQCAQSGFQSKQPTVPRMRARWSLQGIALMGGLSLGWASSMPVALACPAVEMSRSAAEQVAVMAEECTEHSVLSQRLMQLAQQQTQRLSNPEEKSRAQILLFEAHGLQETDQVQTVLAQTQMAIAQVPDDATRFTLMVQLAESDEAYAQHSTQALYDNAYQLLRVLPDAPVVADDAEAEWLVLEPEQNALEDAIWALASWYVESKGRSQADAAERVAAILPKFQQPMHRALLRDRVAEVEAELEPGDEVWESDADDGREAPATDSEDDWEDSLPFGNGLYSDADQAAIAQIEDLWETLRQETTLTTEQFNRLDALVGSLEGELAKLVYVEGTTEILAEQGDVEGTVRFAEQLMQEVEDYAGDALLVEAQTLFPTDALPEFLAAILLARFNHLESSRSLIEAQPLNLAQKQFQAAMALTVGGAMQLGDGDPVLGLDYLMQSQQLVLAMEAGELKAEALVAIAGVQSVLQAGFALGLSENSDVNPGAPSIPFETLEDSQRLIAMALAMKPDLQEKVDGIQLRVEMLQAFAEADDDLEEDIDSWEEGIDEELSYLSYDDVPEEDWVWLDSPVGEWLLLLKAGRFEEVRGAIADLEDAEARIEALTALAAYGSVEVDTAGGAVDGLEVKAILRSAIALTQATFVEDSEMRQLWLNGIGQEFVGYGGGLLDFQAALDVAEGLAPDARDAMNQAALTMVYDTLTYNEPELAWNQRQLAQILPQPPSELRTKSLVEIAQNFAILDSLQEALRILDPLPAWAQIDGWLRVATLLAEE